jgi:hypothetical protein
MDFYTTLFVVTVVFSVIMLCFVGYFMSISRKNETYPPSIADCPDYYTLNSTGICNAGSNITTSDPVCNSEDFTKDIYKPSGTNFTSGLCAKKQWANKCNVTWDGISNNDSLCYA